MPADRSIARAGFHRAAAPMALACGLLLAGCKSDSSPSQPDPDPAGGAVVAVRNESRFEVSVGAGFDCQDVRRLEPADDDYSPVIFNHDLSCAAEAQGQPHSANMSAQASANWTFDGPGGSLSEVFMSVDTAGNHSRTGLASSGASLRLRFRFEVVGGAVEYRAVGSISYVDSWPDFFVLKRIGPTPETELFAEYGQGDGQADTLHLNRIGTLDEGTYELWVEMTTLDWFSEELSFGMQFGAAAAD